MTALLLPLEEKLLLNAYYEFDYIPIVIYFAFVIGVGFVMKAKAASSDAFLTGARSLPAWVTGIAFVSANLGAVEIMGMSASSQYGMPTFHYFWVGAIPAMLFLGIVMMPFYYGEGPLGARVHVQALRHHGSPDQRAELRAGAVADRRYPASSCWARSSTGCWAGR